MLPASVRQRLVQLFVHADRDLAEQTRLGGCPHCGAALHAGHYRRKLHGLATWPEAAEASALTRRLSWCCSARDCRSRVLPPSVTFLGLRRYAHVVVLLLTMMSHGEGVRALCKSLGVDRRTLERWREWWRTTFPRSGLWLAIRARFGEPIDDSELPRSLLARLGPSTEAATHAYFTLMAAELRSDRPFPGS